MFLENWQFNSRFVLNPTKTPVDRDSLRNVFDVINDIFDVVKKLLLIYPGKALEYGALAEQLDDLKSFNLG